MKKMCVEDRSEMVWLPVVCVNRNGVPMFDKVGCYLDDDAIQRCIDWCSAHDLNWCVSELIHEVM